MSTTHTSVQMMQIPKPKYINPMWISTWSGLFVFRFLSLSCSLAVTLPVLSFSFSNKNNTHTNTRAHKQQRRRRRRWRQKQFPNTFYRSFALSAPPIVNSVSVFIFARFCTQFSSGVPVQWCCVHLHFDELCVGNSINGWTCRDLCVKPRLVWII